MAELTWRRKVIGRLSAEFLLCKRQDEVVHLEGDAFKVGTGAKCEIRFDPEDDRGVAAHHCTLLFREHKWYVVPTPEQRLWLNEKEVDKYSPVPNGSFLFFGRPMGPGLRIFGQAEVTVSRRTLAQLLQRGGRQGRMVKAAATHVATEFSRQREGIRRAMTRLRRLHSRRFRWVLAALVAVAVIGTSAIYYQSRKLQQLRVIAEDIFYQKKALEVHIAQQRLQGLDTEEAEAQLVELTRSYDYYLEELDISGTLAGYTDRLILRMARVFGESELHMPDEFAATVKEYIKKWQSTDRLRISIERSINQGYVNHIVKSLLDERLPPHLYYLALQESDFDTSRCGPNTRFGIAKGMWQFMPATALQYGLQLGPLVKVRVPDALDERHHFRKSTEAASRYLRNIYATEAQASGLLVLASYNYGENRVRKMIRELADNPRERNFWNLMRNYDLPKQTRDYVFYIFSAAVICEDPEYFGFKFTNPLDDIIDSYSTDNLTVLGQSDNGHIGQK